MKLLALLVNILLLLLVIPLWLVVLTMKLIVEWSRVLVPVAVMVIAGVAIYWLTQQNL